MQNSKRSSTATHDSGFADSDGSTPTALPSTQEFRALVPRGKTVSVAHPVSAVQHQPIPRANSAPNRPIRIPPRETTEFVVYALFRIWHRFDANADIPEHVFTPLADRVHLFLCQTGVGMTLSLLYITRLRTASPANEVISLGSEYRVLVSALILAQKWLKDDRLSNRYWARTSCLDIAELNAMEMHCLTRLSFGLYVRNEEFDKWKIVVKAIGLENERRRARAAGLPA
ncbi:MAG: hypothetical protein SGCHY_004886 [Lobulomycetales sp.]